MVLFVCLSNQIRWNARIFSMTPTLLGFLFSLVLYVCHIDLRDGSFDRSHHFVCPIRLVGVHTMVSTSDDRFSDFSRLWSDYLLDLHGDHDRHSALFDLHRHDRHRIVQRRIDGSSSFQFVSFLAEDRLRLSARLRLVQSIFQTRLFDNTKWWTRDIWCVERAWLEEKAIHLKFVSSLRFFFFDKWIKVQDEDKTTTITTSNFVRLLLLVSPTLIFHSPCRVQFSSRHRK